MHGICKWIYFSHMDVAKMKTYFGTDGIRGCVGQQPITAEFMLKLGWAAGKVFSSKKTTKVVIGKDTRISGYMIESALQAGLSAAGVNVFLLGPMPTSAVAYLTRALRADAGIVISASHNAFDDNGIKFFSAEGFKFPTDIEQLITQQMELPLHTASSTQLGKAFRINDAAGRYIEFCKSTVPHRTSLTGLKIVVDCANGATYHIAPHVFSELGASVISTHVHPTGTNINEHCGSNHPDVLRHQVLAHKADLGIAFDGDGDRVIMVDHAGEILDGDELLYIIAKELVNSRHFAGGVVGTLMSNTGLEIAFQALGIPFLRVAVGDQHVIHALLENKWLLGGEPSGHIVYLHVNTTADGVIAALQVLSAMRSSGKSLHDLKQGIHKFSQRKINIPHQGVAVNLQRREIKDAIKQAEFKLGKQGRILVRCSGTEPVVRIMVESEDANIADEIIEEMSGVIKKIINQQSAMLS